MANDDKTLVERLRDGEPCGGDKCKVMDARSGCLCATVADRIEVLEDEADAWNRKAVTAMEERNAALAQVAAASPTATQESKMNKNPTLEELEAMMKRSGGSLCLRGTGITAETLRLRARVEALEGALRAVIGVTRAYLPPDSIDARAAYDDALRKARAEGMREAAKMAHGKTVQEHYVEWPWWGRGNRSKESELAVFSKHLSDAILARADQIEKGEDHG